MKKEAQSTFSDKAAVSTYAVRTARIVPALHDLHRMAGLLLAEGQRPDARVLVLGAGGGMELKAWAELHRGWSFVGIDPSEEMLELARITTAEHVSRIALQAGYIDDAPQNGFDAAACLLTFHFLKPPERLRTLQAIGSRLKPGAPFVMAHYSFPTAEDGADRWLGRVARYAESNGQGPGDFTALKQLPVLSPEDEMRMLHTAGFVDVELFYTALAFRGWVARKLAAGEGRRPAETPGRIKVSREPSIGQWTKAPSHR